MNRRMPNGTYGGVRGRGRKAPAYSMCARHVPLPGMPWAQDLSFPKLPVGLFDGKIPLKAHDG